MFVQQPPIEPVACVGYLHHEGVLVHLDLANVDGEVDQDIMASLWDGGELFHVTLALNQSSTVLLIAAISAVLFGVAAFLHRHAEGVRTSKALRITGVLGQVGLVGSHSFLGAFHRIVVDDPFM